MDHLTEIEGHSLLEVTSFTGLTLTNKLNFSKFKRERVATAMQSQVYTLAGAEKRSVVYF